MSDSENIISIKILDHSYKIKCPQHEAQDLQESARYVDEHMRKLRQSGTITSPDRLAVVTALNICSELIALKRQKNNYIDKMSDRLQELQNRIQNFLIAEEEVTVSGS